MIVDAAALAAAVAALAAGLPVILPTDTVYGVGVVPTVFGATARLFELKARPTTVALPVLAADVAQAFALADLKAVAPEVVELATGLWPGPLTIVVPRRAGLDLDLGGTDDATIGLRVPDHDAVRSLAASVGPLAVTSANRHGAPTPATAAGAAAALGGGVLVVVDGGRCDGEPSTVVQWIDDGFVVLRAGRLPIEAIAGFGTIHRGAADRS